MREIFLAQQISELRKKIKQRVESNDNLRGRRELLDRVPRLGENTIPWLIACLGDSSRFARSNCAAAYSPGYLFTGKVRSGKRVQRFVAQ